MAHMFANMLSALSGLINNGISTYTVLFIWDETECPEEML